MPHAPYSCDHAPSDYFFFASPDKKVLRGKSSDDVEEVKQKMAEALKGIKLMSPKTILNSGKNISIGVLHQMKSTLKVTEV